MNDKAKQDAEEAARIASEKAAEVYAECMNTPEVSEWLMRIANSAPLNTAPELVAEMLAHLTARVFRVAFECGTELAFERAVTRFREWTEEMPVIVIQDIGPDYGPEWSGPSMN